MFFTAMCISFNVHFKELVAAVPRPSPNTFSLLVSDMHSEAAITNKTFGEQPSQPIRFISLENMTYFLFLWINRLADSGRCKFPFLFRFQFLWFLRKCWKCKKFTDGQTDRWADGHTEDGQNVISVVQLCVQLRLAKN